MLNRFAIWKKTHTDTRFFRSAYRFLPRFFVVYLLGAYFLLSLLNTGLFAVRTLPSLMADAGELWQDLHKNWPEDVTARLDNNELSLEGAAELALPIPGHLAKRYNLPSHAALLSETLLEASRSATPAAVIGTRDTLAVWGPGGGYWSGPWELLEFDTVEIHKNTFAQQEAAFETTLQTLGWTLIITTFALNWLGLLLLRVIVLIFYAWIGQALLWISGSKVSFGDTYKIGLFLFPIVEEILFGVKLLSPDIPMFDFWMVWLVLLAAVGFTNRGQLGNAR
jgi:hypothetical protein